MPDSILKWLCTAVTIIGVCIAFFAMGWVARSIRFGLDEDCANPNHKNPDEPLYDDRDDEATPNPDR